MSTSSEMWCWTNMGHQSKSKYCCSQCALTVAVASRTIYVSVSYRVVLNRLEIDHWTVSNCPIFVHLNSSPSPNEVWSPSARFGLHIAAKRWKIVCFYQKKVNTKPTSNHRTAPSHHELPFYQTMAAIWICAPMCAWVCLPIRFISQTSSCITPSHFVSIASQCQF